MSTRNLYRGFYFAATLFIVKVTTVVRAVMVVVDPLMPLLPALLAGVVR